MVVEIDADNRLGANVLFDLDDIDTAFEELDARYLDGEAAAYVHTWSVVAAAYAAFNRREQPATTPDWVNIDHRRGTEFAPGDVFPYVRSAWEVAPDINIYIASVHRLSSLGAVVTYAANGTSGAGFDAEWRETTLLTFEGDLLNRCEIFDDTDIDAALAKFEEVISSATQLENAATRARAADPYNRRGVEGFLALANGRYEDRRKGLRDEGAADAKFAHAVLSETPRSWRLEIAPVAIRGDRLALTHETFRDTDDANCPITVELMTLTQVGDDELVSYTVFFDADDINGAMRELTARWIASGEVAHPQVIESASQLIEAGNRHDWDALATREAGTTYVNHRQLAGDADTIVDHWSSIRMMASLIPDMWIELAEFLTHSARGVVTNIVVKGTTAEGAAIELPAVILLLFDGDRVTRIDGDRVTRMEAFDADQRDQTLARFDELNRPA
jgi:hypothetical protein